MDIKSKMPGKIMEVKCKVGDTVKKGTVLLIMEAMKMKNPIPAPVDGVIKEVKTDVNARVNPGDVMIVIE